MPTNLVKTKRDERLWAKAKTQARKEYPKVKADSDRWWSIVNGIYQRMKHRTGSRSAKRASYAKARGK